MNFKGIYAVLSQIWKCRKSRVFGAKFWANNTAGATFFSFCNYGGWLGPGLGRLISHKYHFCDDIIDDGNDGDADDLVKFVINPMLLWNYCNHCNQHHSNLTNQVLFFIVIF